MKLALFTTPAGARSGIGDYTRHLLPYLRERADVDVFVETGREEGGELPASAIDPRAYDQLLYQLGNEQQHAYMAHLVRTLGGTVVLHDWVLFDLALAAWPVLERGGVRGARLAWREGGLRQALRLAAALRGAAGDPPAGADLALAGGWHDAEPGGRWCADRGHVALGEPAPDAFELDLVLPAGQRLALDQGGALDSLEGPFDGTHATALRPGATTTLELRVSGIAPTSEQRATGDARRLGAFVRALRVRRRARAWEALDLSAAPVTGEGGLAAARFDLPLNRSIVREADAFLVHHEWMAERVREDRNAPTPIAVVHHGAEPRWRETDRRAARAALDLPPGFADGFLLVSLGAVQAHKRIGPLLDGFALARRARPDLRLLLVGEERPREVDLAAETARRGLADAVHCTGWLPEGRAWDLLHAADLAVNLRGPSTGGASGGVFQAFSHGRGVVVGDDPGARALPDGAVRRVPTGAGEVNTLAATLQELAERPEDRAAMERAARRFVEEHCAWSRVADRYFEALAAFPAAKAAKKSLFQLVREAGEREEGRRRAATAGRERR